jgi:hypothetical protein
MKYKVKVLVEKYVALISKWEGIECITLNEAALPDTLDSYFALILDVFYTGTILPPTARMELYGSDLAAFESTGNKDRFLIDGLPLRFEFKSVKRIDELVSSAAEGFDSRRPIRDNSGTYSFYRLVEGEILFSRGDWLANLRKKLKKLPAAFWNILRHVSQSKMEHYLSDMGAALIQDDDFFYLISAAGFIKEACLALFCVNKKFEPSNKQYYKQVLELKTQAPSFRAQLDTFLRTDTESTMERKYSAAQLIARGILAL